MELLDCPPIAVLATVMRDGSPQVSVVWCDFDGRLIRVNTMRGFAKQRNMQRDPRVALVTYDPAEPSRFVRVAGLVEEMSTNGAAEHLDEIASRYLKRPVAYFGDVIPARFATTETPVLCRIRPVEVSMVTAEDEPDGEEVLEIDTMALPVSHLDLLARDLHAVIATTAPDGHPISTLAPLQFEGRSTSIHMAADPTECPIAVLVVDPLNTSRFIQLRGHAIAVSGTPRRSWLAVHRYTVDAIHA
jgi:PPOX class probable F420-dependent enzyme